MSEINTGVPVFLTLDHFKKILGGHQFSDRAIELLYEYNKYISDRSGEFSIAADLQDVLDNWSFDTDGKKIFEEFADIFSFEDYCQAMNLDPQEVSKGDIRQYAYTFCYDLWMGQDMIVLNDGSVFYRNDAIALAHERLRNFDVFHKEAAFALESRIQI